MSSVNRNGSLALSIAAPVAAYGGMLAQMHRSLNNTTVGEAAQKTVTGHATDVLNLESRLGKLQRTLATNKYPDGFVKVIPNKTSMFGGGIKTVHPSNAELTKRIGSTEASIGVAKADLAEAKAQVAILTEERAAMPAMSRISGAASVFSLIGIFSESRMASRRLTEGKTFAGVAHAVATLGNSALFMSAVTGECARAGSIGLAIAVVGSTTGLLADMCANEAG